MFWGLNLKPNRKYSQKAHKSFHVSHAALDGDTVTGDGENKIFLITENEKFLICTLKKGKIDQVMLDLNFAEGDDICFHSVGNGHVCLSGYIIQDMPGDFDDLDDLEEEEVESDAAMDILNGDQSKNKKQKESKPQSKNESQEDDESSSDDEDFTLDSTTLEQQSDDDDDDEDEDDEEDDDDDDDDESEDDAQDEEAEEPKKKQPKLEKSNKSSQVENGVSKKDSNASVKSQGKKDKQGKNEQPGSSQKQQQSQQKSGERTLAGGVKVEDIRVGNGPEAKSGKRVSVYYEGRLKTNNKIFDSLKTGQPFKFGLGKGDVIKGWEIGLQGMKVGGKRRIICPPHVAYGQRGSPPQIPPNSTLIFEVELKGVN